VSFFLFFWLVGVCVCRCLDTAQRVNSLSDSIAALTKLSDLEASALLHASARGDVVQAQALFERGVDINAVDYDMRSALHIAAAEGTFLQLAGRCDVPKQTIDLKTARLCLSAKNFACIFFFFLSVV
jgi:hypothetical protein